MYRSPFVFYTISGTKPQSKERGIFMDTKAVGRRIRAKREQENMTQEFLAELIDVSPNHISVIERGVKIPRLDTFVAIANALSVSADELLMDVVDQSTVNAASELSSAIEKLPQADRLRILKAIHSLVDF